MKLKKERMPLVSEITRSTQNATKVRPFKVVDKYTKLFSSYDL